tara:strand:+ start:448 stop:657 length:210 start_codon:yes stop_codon:yes gene_type:complete
MQPSTNIVAIFKITWGNQPQVVNTYAEKPAVLIRQGRLFCVMYSAKSQHESTVRKSKLFFNQRGTHDEK